MDGVLCNFEKRYKELYGDISDRDRRSTFRPNFADFIDTNQFASLEPMPDFPVLRTYLSCLDVPKQILSSTAYEETYETISRQKKEWLQKYNVTWPDPIFVPGKRHKYKFAQPDTIIIDDTWSVIEDWRNHNGIAIWHKDAISTINQLELYVKSPK